jgi:hypothetical protein
MLRRHLAGCPEGILPSDSRQIWIKIALSVAATRAPLSAAARGGVTISKQALKSYPKKFFLSSKL